MRWENVMAYATVIEFSPGDRFTCSSVKECLDLGNPCLRHLFKDRYPPEGKESLAHFDNPLLPVINFTDGHLAVRLDMLDN